MKKSMLLKYLKMAIVLPRRKKRTDIFAPRKSVQDAKEKLGPAFFDLSLLECSRNAIELNKLVSRWEEIDKEKLKFIRELTREQNALARSYKNNRLLFKDERKTGSSEHCIETIDGKQIPPGFRFRSNGDLKYSSISLPHVSISESDEHIFEKSSLPNLTVKNSDSFSVGADKGNSNYDAINFNKEIETLREIIVELCEELSKSKISLSTSYSGSLRSYLRGHTTECKSFSDFTSDLYQNPNDRFAYQPGSSEKRSLYKQTLKTPSSRACVGCQFKLKLQSEDLQKLKLQQEKDVLKRKWNYVPTGKYVQSSMTPPSSSTHLGKSSSSSAAFAKSNTGIINSPKPSSVKFRVDSELAPKKETAVPIKHDENTQPEGRSKSLSFLNRRSQSARSLPRAKSDTTKLEQKAERNVHSSMSKRSTTKSGSSATSDTYCIGRSLGSSFSYGSRISSSRVSSRLLADYDSRLNLLKEFQVLKRFLYIVYLCNIVKYAQPQICYKDVSKMYL